jgi:DNA repair protein RecO (recombination protein O)
VVIEKTLGVILRAVDFSETSKIATLFTRDFGKLGVMAKGGRRLKSSFDVSLDILSVLSICVLRKPSAELDLLTEAALEERFSGLRSDLRALHAAYYVAEILEGLTRPHDPHPALFEETIRTLRKLAAGDDRTAVLGRFQLRLLAETGFAMSLDSCAGCGAAEPVADRMRISVKAGGLLCIECAKFQPTMAVQGGAVQSLRVLAADDDTNAGRLTMTPAIKNEVRQATTQAIEYHLGRRPRTAGMVVW